MQPPRWCFFYVSFVAAVVVAVVVVFSTYQVADEEFIQLFSLPQGNVHSYPLLLFSKGWFRQTLQVTDVLNSSTSTKMKPPRQQLSLEMASILSFGLSLTSLHSAGCTSLSTSKRPCFRTSPHSSFCCKNTHYPELPVLPCRMKTYRRLAFKFSAVIGFPGQCGLCFKNLDFFFQIGVRWLCSRIASVPDRFPIGVHHGDYVLLARGCPKYTH
jgi:hypothetical protein